MGPSTDDQSGRQIADENFYPAGCLSGQSRRPQQLTTVFSADKRAAQTAFCKIARYRVSCCEAAVPDILFALTF